MGNCTPCEAKRAQAMGGLAPATRIEARNIAVQCFHHVQAPWLGGAIYASRGALVIASPAQTQLLLMTRGTTPDLVNDPKRNGHSWLLTKREDFEWMIGSEQAWLAANTDPETAVTAEGLA